MSKWYLVVNDQIVNSYPALADANEALDKRKARDDAAGSPTKYIYQILKENV